MSVPPFDVIDRAGVVSEYDAVRAKFPLPLAPGLTLPVELPAPPEPPEGAMYQRGCGLMFAIVWWLEATLAAILEAHDRGDAASIAASARALIVGTRTTEYQATVDEDDDFTAAELAMPALQGNVAPIRAYLHNDLSDQDSGT